MKSVKSRRINEDLGREWHMEGKLQNMIEDKFLPDIWYGENKNNIDILTNQVESVIQEFLASSGQDLEEVRPIIVKIIMDIAKNIPQ